MKPLSARSQVRPKLTRQAGRPKMTRITQISKILKTAYRLHIRDKSTRLAVKRCLG